MAGGTVCSTEKGFTVRVPELRSGENASCCGTIYPTSGRSLAVKPDVSACFSITYNGTCDGKLLALFRSYYEPHIARPSLWIADTDAKSWVYRGGGPDDWDWNRGQHDHLQLDALDAAQSAARRHASGAHRGDREHGAGRRADHDVLPGLP